MTESDSHPASTELSGLMGWFATSGTPRNDGSYPVNLPLMVMISPEVTISKTDGG